MTILIYLIAILGLGIIIGLLITPIRIFWSYLNDYR